MASRASPLPIRYLRGPADCAWRGSAIDEVLVHERAKARDVPLFNDFLIEARHDGFASLQRQFHKLNLVFSQLQESGSISSVMHAVRPDFDSNACGIESRLGNDIVFSAMRKPPHYGREFMYGIVPPTLAIVVVLCLGSFTAERAVGQVLKGAVASTSAVARFQARTNHFK
jgi:hypothetical protein